MLRACKEIHLCFPAYSLPDQQNHGLFSCVLWIDLLGPRRAWVQNGIEDTEKYRAPAFDNPLFLYSSIGCCNCLGFTGNFSMGTRLLQKNKP
ncbi:MAG: hypothetical protein JNL57_03890 [Bacteroidetes bacterium]|nr:hypothetical protein [Bacteroidota bacterium]